MQTFPRPEDALEAVGGVNFDEAKERARVVWGLGDYQGLGRALEPAAQALADACAVSAGQEVLDVAAGDGNFALAAAREGASVVATDLSPGQVERGRARSQAEGYEIEWLEADAEALPFEAGRFDCAGSVFGAMFAPRPEVAAAELFRVVRPGNTIGMASWTPDSFSAGMFDLSNRYVPRAPGAPLPAEWGDEEKVRERFEGLAGSLEIERRTLDFVSSGFDQFWNLVVEPAPTQVAMRSVLDDEAWAAYRDELYSLLGEHNEAQDGSVLVRSPYLLVVARKRG